METLARGLGQLGRAAETPVEVDCRDGGGQLATWIFSGESADNTSQGVVYVELTDTAGTRKVSVFSDAGKTNKVAEGTRVGDGVLVLEARTGSVAAKPAEAAVAPSAAPAAAPAAIASADTTTLSPAVRRAHAGVRAPTAGAPGAPPPASPAAPARARDRRARRARSPRAG